MSLSLRIHVHLPVYMYKFKHTYIWKCLFFLGTSIGRSFPTISTTGPTTSSTGVPSTGDYVKYIIFAKKNVLSTGSFLLKSFLAIF